MGKLLEIKGFNGIKKKPRMTCFTRKGFKRFFIFNIVKDKSFSSSLGSLSRLPSRPRFFPFISPPPVSPLPPRSLLPLFFFSKGKIPSAQHFFTHEKKNKSLNRGVSEDPTQRGKASLMKLHNDEAADLPHSLEPHPILSHLPPQSSPLHPFSVL